MRQVLSPTHSQLGCQTVVLTMRLLALSPGGLFEVGAGWAAKLRWERTHGKFFNVKNGLKPEQLRDNWNDITDFSSNTSHPATTQESLSTIVSGLQQAKL